MENKIYQLLFDIEKKISKNSEEINNIKEQVWKLSSLLNSLDDKSKNNIIKKNIELVILKDGFNLDKSFLKKCFIRNSSIADLDVLKEYYIQKDIIFPIKKESKKLLYYKENKWNDDNNNYITNTVIDNLVNSYLSILMEEDNFLESNYNRNLHYAHKIQNSNLYKKRLIKEFLTIIYDE